MKATFAILVFKIDSNPVADLLTRVAATRLESDSSR